MAFLKKKKSSSFRVFSGRVSEQMNDQSKALAAYENVLR